MREPKKMVSKRDPRKNTQVNIWLNPATRERLQWLQVYYAKVLGREVSSTVIIRRAIEALLLIQKPLVEEHIVDKIHLEAAALARHVR